MSPICQTFVQNAWKKDLCSNCFKTEDEHGRKSGGYRCHAQPSGSGYDSSSSDGSAIQINNGGGRRKHPITSAILNRADSRAGERAMGDGGSSESQSSGTTTSTAITTPQSRYVGVSNSRIGYPRSYYGGVGGSPWKSRLGDASEASGLKSPSLIFRSDSSNTASGLRSPALIKGISSSSSSTTSSNGYSNEHSSNSDLFSTKLSPVPLSKNNETISGSSSSLSSSASSPPVMLPRTYFPSNINERPSKFFNSSPEFYNSVEEKNLKNTELTNSVRHQFLFGESSHSASSMNSPRDLNADVIRRSNLSSSEYRSENTRGLRYSSQSISNSTDDYSNRPVRSRSADDILATPVTDAKTYVEGSVGNPSAVHTVKRVACDISSSVGDVTFASRNYDDNDKNNDQDNVQQHNDSGILSANVSSEVTDSTVHNISDSSSAHNNGHISSTMNNHTRFSEEPQNNARELRISNNGIRDLESLQNSHQSSLWGTSEGGKTSSCVGSSSSTSTDSETSEATSVADSTESEDHCGGFYNIEGLGEGEEEDSDEEKGVTHDKNESSTDDAVGEDRPTQIIDDTTDDAGAPSDESVDETGSTLAEECDLRKTQPPGKKSSLSSKKAKSSVGGPTRNITFNPSDEVIGYGGDVDYSDGEDVDDEDDDDDENDSLASFELTQREKLLKKLTLQNTDFNAENDNFGDDIVLQDDHYELIKKFELACEDYNIYDDMKSTYDATKCLRANITPERGSEKSDVKVKLRRSTPLVSVKPFISRTESPKVNPVLPMKNGELIRTRSDGSPLDREIVPLQGIKPKYVSKEEEIVEKDSEGAMFDYDKRRVTSFGSNADSDSKERVTSFGSETSPEKVTSFGSETLPEKVTSFGSETTPEKVTSFGSETSPEKVTSFGSETTSEKITSFGPENPKEKVTSFGVDASQKEKITSFNNGVKNSLSNEKSSTSRQESENEKVTRLDSTAIQVKEQSPVPSNHVGNTSAHETLKPVVKPVRQKKKSKFLSSSQPLLSKTSKILSVTTTSKDISQNGIQTNIITYSQQFTDIPKKSKGVFNDKVIKNEIIRTSTHKNESEGSNRSTNISAAAVETPDVQLENRLSTNSNSAKIEPVSQQSIDQQNRVPSITKEGDGILVSDRGGASRPSVHREPLVRQVTSHVNSEVTSRITKETKYGTSSSLITESKDEISSPRILERKPEISSPVEMKPSPCKRRSSFMASQLGITDPEDEESNPETVENTANIPLKLVDVDPAASSVQPIYTQLRNVHNNFNSPTSNNLFQNESESENVSCAVIKKSARSRRGGGLSGDKDVWSDTASNSTDNDETKSSSSSEIYRDASSQQGSSSSHRSSTSSLMTSFGTPVVNGSTPPQPSFLHSEAARAIYETPSSSSATDECSSTGYTTSKDFLKEIKAPPDQPAPTAGIQKSGFYATSSCLKGLPGSSRPVQTPRPPSVSRQSSSDTNSSSVPGVVGSPSSHVARDLTSTFAAMAAPDSLKVLPNDPAHAEEVVYDLPVTVAQSSANSTTGSLHYSTSSLLVEDHFAANVPTSPAKDEEEPTSEIYYEVDLNDDDHHYQVVDAIGTNKVVEHSTPPADGEAKSRFEAKRSFISSNLNMNMLTPQYSQEGEEVLYETSKPAPNHPSNQPGQLQQDSERRATLAEPTSSVTVNELLRFQHQRRVQDPSSRNLPPPQLPDILQGQAILPHSVGEHQSDSQPDQPLPVSLDDAVAFSRPTEVDSYSSFTDDFDEDDDDDDDAVSLTNGQDGAEQVGTVDKQQALAAAVAEGILNSNAGLRRVGERSSSATPFFRNSVGPTNYDATGIRKHLVSTPSAFLTLRPNKKEKGRSHSCPRNADHVVVSTPLPQQLPPQQQKTSKFSFVKASFFRPTSPPPAPTQSPTGAATRGRDRCKKTSLSRFSLKKFLRIGSSSSTEAKDDVKDEEKRAREALKQAEREAKKSKLNIIHPLDYNKTAVQVIARPEKTSPAYDYTNLHAYTPASKQTKEAPLTQHQQPNKLTPTGTDLSTRSKTPTVGPSQDQGKDTALGGGSVGTTSPVRSPGPTAAELMYRQSKERHLQQLAQQQQQQKQQHSSQQKQAQQQRHPMPESPVYNNIAYTNNSPAVTNTIADTNISTTTKTTKNHSIYPPINNSPSDPVNTTGTGLTPSSLVKRVPTSPWGVVSPSSAPIFPVGAVSPSSVPNGARGPASPISVVSGVPNFPGDATSPTPPSNVGRSSSVPSVQPFTLSTVPPGSVAATVVPLRRNTSFTTGPEGRLERRASSAGDGASLARASCPQGLGFNSEGRPKPPPPPRKTSLEQRLQQQKEDVIYQVPVVRDYNLVPPQENKQQQQQLQQQLLHKDLQQRIQSIMSDAGRDTSNIASGPNKPQSSAKHASLESTEVVPGFGVPSSQPVNPNLKNLNPGFRLSGTSAESGINTAPPRPDVKKGGMSPARPGPPPVPASKPRLTGTSSSPANVLPPQPINKNSVGKGPTQHKLVRQNALEDVTENSSQANHAMVESPNSRVENSRNSISSNGHRVSTSSTTSDSRPVETRGVPKPAAGVSQPRKPPPTGSAVINGVAPTCSTVPPNSYCPRTTASSTGRGLQRSPPNPALSPSGGGNGGGGVCSPIRPKAPPVLPARTCGGLPGGNMQPPPVPIRDSVYANLGDVRAPFTPRKPGRASSLKDEDKKATQQWLQEAAEQGWGQEEDVTAESQCNLMGPYSTSRVVPGEKHLIGALQGSLARTGRKEHISEKRSFRGIQSKHKSKVLKRNPATDLFLKNIDDRRDSMGLFTNVITSKDLERNPAGNMHLKTVDVRRQNMSVPPDETSAPTSQNVTKPHPMSASASRSELSKQVATAKPSGVSSKVCEDCDYANCSCCTACCTVCTGLPCTSDLCTDCQLCRVNCQRALFGAAPFYQKKDHDYETIGSDDSSSDDERGKGTVIINDFNSAANKKTETSKGDTQQQQNDVCGLSNGFVKSDTRSKSKKFVRRKKEEIKHIGRSFYKVHPSNPAHLKADSSSCLLGTKGTLANVAQECSRRNTYSSGCSSGYSSQSSACSSSSMRSSQSSVFSSQSSVSYDIRNDVLNALPLKYGGGLQRSGNKPLTNDEMESKSGLRRSNESAKKYSEGLPRKKTRNVTPNFGLPNALEFSTERFPFKKSTVSSGSGHPSKVSREPSKFTPASHRLFNVPGQRAGLVLTSHEERLLSEKHIRKAIVKPTPRKPAKMISSSIKNNALNPEKIHSEATMFSTEYMKILKQESLYSGNTEMETLTREFHREFLQNKVISEQKPQPEVFFCINSPSPQHDNNSNMERVHKVTSGNTWRGISTNPVRSLDSFFQQHFQSLQEEGAATSDQTTTQADQLPRQDPLYDSPATITHEALTKIMNKVCSGSSLPSAAYVSVARDTRSWQDVALQGDAPPVKAGLRVFQCGSVRQTPVTVVITPEPTLEPHPLLGPPPLAVLKEARVGGTVWVMPRLVLRSLPQYRALLSDQLRAAPESSTAQRRTLALVLLQLVAAFKQLQARGIEEASLDLLLLADPETGSGAVPRLVVAAPAPACPFPLPASPSSLCQVAVAAAENLGSTLSPEAGGPSGQAAAVFGATVAVLRQERAGSLTKAQCLLEAFAFGPSTLAQDDDKSLSEDRLQRWLDSNRTALLRRLSHPTAPRDGSRPTDDYLQDAANSGNQGSARTSSCSSTYDAHEKKELLEGAEDGISDVFELEGADRKVYQRLVSLEEKFQLMFLVRTNARSLAQSLALINN